MLLTSPIRPFYPISQPLQTLQQNYRTPAQAHTELLFKVAAFPGKLAPNLTKPLRVHRK
jgi:hypothetical protein